MSQRAEAGGADSSAAVIVAAARELFAQRGFHQVTIRDIAARANRSPAMVMKCWGSKQDLFYQAATIDSPPLPDVPDEELGRALVRDLVERAQGEVLEPLNRALNLRLSAPDPDSVRERLAEAYFVPLTERLGGGGDARLRAELVVAALAGLAASLRLFEAPASLAAPEEVIHRYGRAIQLLVDG